MFGDKELGVVKRAVGVSTRTLDVGVPCDVVMGAGVSEAEVGREPQRTSSTRLHGPSDPHDKRSTG